MVTKFQLIDSEGKVLADGEIENGIYRVFSSEFSNGYAEFENLEDIVWGQRDTALFCSPASTRQLGLFGKIRITHDPMRGDAATRPLHHHNERYKTPYQRRNP